MSEYGEEYQTSILTKEGLFTLKEYRDDMNFSAYPDSVI